MADTASDQIRQIAEQFAGYAKAVQNYRFQNFEQLTEKQEADLRKHEASLRASSNSLLNTSINLALDDAQAAIDGLKKVTDAIDSDLKRLADIGKAIGVIGTLVQLGAAIATGNPAGIGKAIATTIDTLKSAVSAAPAARAGADSEAAAKGGAGGKH